jgi:hypothetical protein
MNSAASFSQTVLALSIFGVYIASSSPAFADSVDSGAPIGSTGSDANVKIEVTAGTKEKVASLSVNALHIAGFTQNPSETVINLTVSTPYDGESDSAPASLSGLANSTNLAVKISHFRSSTKAGPPTGRQLALLDLATERCKTKAILGRRTDFDAAGNAVSAWTISEIDDRYKKALLACSTSGEGGTDAGSLVDSFLSPDEQREFHASSYSQDSSVIALTGTVGYKKFEYFDALTLVKGKSTKTPWSVKAAYTGYSRKDPLAYTFSVAFERAYEDADKGILCPPPTGMLPVSCINGPVGIPKFEKNLLLGAGLRYRFMGKEKARNLAISPSITYDALNKVFGAELPIYLVPNKDGQLTGGIKFGYRSDEKKPFAGIFIGTAFGLVD